VTFTEWFSGIAILNLSWLLFSLPIVTLIPATDAVFEVVNEWKEDKKPENIFEQFKYYFQKNFKQSFKLGLPIFIVVIIVIADLYFLSSLTLAVTWFQIFKYAFYTLMVLIFLAILYAYPLAKRTGIRSFRIFLMGLMLMVGNPKVTISLLIMLIAFVLFFQLVSRYVIFLTNEWFSLVRSNCFGKCNLINVFVPVSNS